MLSPAAANVRRSAMGVGVVMSAVLRTVLVLSTSTLLSLVGSAGANQFDERRRHVRHEHVVDKTFGGKNYTELTPEEIEKLSPEDRWRYEHVKMHDVHKGHEGMHLTMVLVLFGTLIVCQVILIQWRQRHYKSYQMMTLLAMWVIPVAICAKNAWWRFIIIWLIFSLVTGLVVRKAVQKPLAGTTPRMVYKWFLLVHKVTCGIGVFGYVVGMLTIFGVNLIFNSKPQPWMDFALLLGFYGLYYGVLARDIAEICSDKMAAHVGFYVPQGIANRSLDPSMCAICGNRLLVGANDDAVLERTYRLSCSHEFHEFCIRGWCIVGKKQICPYCKEKVDLKRMFCNFWEKPHVFFGQLLDWVRWLVAWQPLILTLVHGINWALGLE